MEVFLVMQLEKGSGVFVKDIGNMLVGYRKHEFIGLDGSWHLGADAALDEASFISLKQISFMDEIVHGPCLGAITEYKFVAIVKYPGKGEDNDNEGDKTYFPESAALFHVNLTIASPYCKVAEDIYF